MRAAFRKLLWWVQDYVYAVGGQLRAAVSHEPADSFRSGERRPVIVIPGVYESWQFMLPLITGLHAAGHPVHVIPDLHRNRLAVQASAQIVARYLQQAGLQDVVIVAHSKGGLIGKYLMVALDPEVRVRHMVAICTPFAGSRYARYLFIPSLRIFSPRDALTLQMAKEERVNSRISSIYGIFDPHIPEGSVLPGAENIALPAVGHFRILGEPVTLSTVLTQMANFPPGAASPGPAGAL